MFFWLNHGHFRKKCVLDLGYDVLNAHAKALQVLYQKQLTLKISLQ
jgi:hypothetical protein